MDDPILEYYFEFSFRSYEEESSQLDLSFIEKRLNLRPTRTYFINLTSKPYRSNTAWIRYSKTYTTLGVIEKFEKFMLVFQKKEKEILEILQHYKQYDMLVNIDFVPTFSCESRVIEGITLNPEIMAFMGRIRARFWADPYLCFNDYEL